jgi:acyl-CoA thioester hydrolase
VRFAETDAQGIANNAEYLVWFEVARVAYLARFRGGYSSLREDGVEALTLETHARYIRPAYFDDRLLIYTRCVDLRGARFRFEYVVERNGERIAEGSTAHACVDSGSFRPTRVPGWLLESITAAESSPVGEPPGSPTPPPRVR